MLEQDDLPELARVACEDQFDDATLQETPSDYFLLVGVVFCQLLWSGMHVMTKLTTNGGLNPMVFAMWRGVIGSLAFFVVCCVSLGRKHGWGVGGVGAIIKSTMSECVKGFMAMPRLFLLIGFLSSVHFTCTVLALMNLSEPATFATMQVLAPCVSCVVSVYLGFESITILKFLGITIAITGAMIGPLSMRGKDGNDDGEQALGLVLVAIQIVSLSTFVTLLKKVPKNMHSTIVTTVYYTIGAVCTITFAIMAVPLSLITPYHGLDTFWFSENPRVGWVSLVYVVLFPTVVCFNTIGWATKHLNPSLVSTGLVLQPVFTSFLSVLVFGLSLAMYECLGIVVVILGLVITLLENHHQQQQHGSGKKKGGGREGGTEGVTHMLGEEEEVLTVVMEEGEGGGPLAVVEGGGGCATDSDEALKMRKETPTHTQVPSLQDWRAEAIGSVGGCEGRSGQMGIVT
jgi:drug/metabolite transporter (DMT)-like permease